MTDNNDNDKNSTNKKRPRHERKQKQTWKKGEARIVIVGGGLAGLSVAISLVKAGFSHVTLYERCSEQEERTGYGLTLSYNPKGPLQTLGILESLAQLDCPSRSHYVFQSDGSILGYFGNAFSNEPGGQRGNLRVPRQVVRQLLCQQLLQIQNNNHHHQQPAVIHWGHELIRHDWNETSQTHQLEFLCQKNKNTIHVEADLLVAADGIRSPIVSNMMNGDRSTLSLSKQSKAPALLLKQQSPSFLRPLNVRLILGISPISHALLNERGFYTLDGIHRLFIMPYQSNRFFVRDDNHDDDDRQNLVMWQLSFATTTDDTTQNTPLDAQCLFEYVWKTVSSWHAPIPDMIQATPLHSIWGTDLMDRDPWDVWKSLQHQQQQQQQPSNKSSRLVVVGDALHPMSPFKGQGANQALKDGPLLAYWLQHPKASMDAALLGFWRETVQRTAPIVQASRLAAQDLHSPTILNYNQHGFARLPKEDATLTTLLTTLQQKSINASLGSQLDGAIFQIIKDMGLLMLLSSTTEKQSTRFQQRIQDAKKEALAWAASGDLPALRQLSLAKHSGSIRTARDDQGRSCLVLAALGNHTATCQWLATEVKCPWEQQVADPHNYNNNNSLTTMRQFLEQHRNTILDDKTARLLDLIEKAEQKATSK